MVSSAGMMAAERLNDIGKAEFSRRSATVNRRAFGAVYIWEDPGLVGPAEGGGRRGLTQREGGEGGARKRLLC